MNEAKPTPPRTNAELHVTLLRSPFRNADQKDWEWLMERLGDGGHGQFWKAVMTEMRGALDLTKKP
jgi:hypothetical protein